ncbi:MAG: adenylate/guanylate cyclase domain-containing protein, partial [Spirochaetaceae bacterium]|nr:adenylate/guanylate cyclase domain-containing protein [Spirochaetaceae bacterium]
SVALFRRDGTPAFSDNRTIDQVNANIKKLRFSPRSASSVSSANKEVSSARLAEAVGMPPSELFFRDDLGDRAYFRALRPLINLPKCTGCHGADHTVRGVIDIRSDVTAVVRAQATTIASGSLGFVAVVAALALGIGSFLRRAVLRPVSSIGKLCAEVAGGKFEGRVEIRGRDEIGELGRTVNEMVEGLYERFELTKYVSAGTLGALRAGQAPRRELRTLLFSDVRGFTAYTEAQGPERVVEVLNALLDGQAEIIQRFQGDIDKFVGDEIVAVFAGQGSARRACEAARAIVDFCASRAKDFDSLAVGVGIASGQVIHGMIGSQRRADYTVIGDPVNLASRLCAIAKPSQILVSDGAKVEVGAMVGFAGPFAARLKGKAGVQKVWILASGGGGSGA